MSQEFDPYYEWLGIPPKDQPPNHYRLLGIELFEANRNVIDTAANRQMGFIKEYQAGPHSELTQRLLNELAAARLCLLNQERKAAYDEDLRANLTAARAPSRPPPLRPARNVQRATPEATGTGEREAGVLRRVPMSPPMAVEPVLPPAIEDIAAELPAEDPVPSRTPRPAESVAWTVVQPAAPATPLRTVGVVAGIAVGLAAAGFAVLLTLWAVPLVRSFRSSALHTAPEEGQHRSLADHPATTAPDVTDQPVSHADEADPAELPSPDTETAARDDRPDAAAHPVPSPPGRLSADEVADARPPAFVGPHAAPLVPEQNQPASPAAVPAASAAGDGRPEPRELPAPRLPPPARSLRDAIAARVTEQFRPEQAASPVAKTRLAKQLLGLADQSLDKHDERFVLLRTAAELACDGGDAALMMQSRDQLAADYDVPEPNMHAHMLKRLLDDGKAPERVVAFLRNCDAVISRAMAVDKLDLAVEMADLAGGLCDRPVGSVEFRKEIPERQARVRNIRAQFQRHQAALVRLESAPDDADAHATAGRWLCLVKGNWDEGLPHLSQGSEPRLKKLAQQELSAANAAPDVLVALGDGWYEMVQSAEADEQLPMLRPADDCYRRAAESSSGLAKAEIDRRRAEIGQHLARLAPSEVQPAVAPDAAQPSPASAEDGESQDLQVLFERALAAGMSGNDFARAERLLARCNQLDPQHIPTLNNLALMSLRRDNYGRAVHLWETAAGLAPENAEVQHNLQCLLRLAQANRLPLDRSLVSSVERLCAEAGRNDPPRGRAHDGWRFLPYGQSQDYDRSYTDCRCLHCGGTRAVACTASGCNGGAVGVQRGDVVGRARNGMPIIHKYTVRQPCSRCSGRGAVPCPTCGGTGWSSF